jgi:hypothetical protein
VCLGDTVRKWRHSSLQLPFISILTPEVTILVGPRKGEYDMGVFRHNYLVNLYTIITDDWLVQRKDNILASPT